MGDKSGIHWTDATWNPLVGCSRVSEGCRNCYAEREAATRLAKTPKYQGLAREVNGHPSWTGEVRLWEPHLDQPLRWGSPRRIFVNSMSDLFHEKVPDEWIDRIFAVMQIAQRHAFQVLTKRPERMRSYLSTLTDERLRAWANRAADGGEHRIGAYNLVSTDHKTAKARFMAGEKRALSPLPRLPLPNVWLGVSVEDQETADERIGPLLKTPAAVRWVSYEPALGPVDFAEVFSEQEIALEPDGFGNTAILGRLGWVVVGGESGPEARPFDLAWARQAVADCRNAGVPCFVKQLGSRPRVEVEEYGLIPLHQRDRKGGDPSEWPEDLRVRDYPAAPA